MRGLRRTIERAGRARGEPRRTTAAYGWPFRNRVRCATVASRSEVHADAGKYAVQRRLVDGAVPLVVSVGTDGSSPTLRLPVEAAPDAPEDRLRTRRRRRRSASRRRVKSEYASFDPGPCCGTARQCLSCHGERRRHCAVLRRLPCMRFSFGAMHAYFLRDVAFWGPPSTRDAGIPRRVLTGSQPARSSQMTQRTSDPCPRLRCMGYSGDRA